ncbi:MAG: hypothetical protein ACFB21_11280 [Opitutales bacterium]
MATVKCKYCLSKIEIDPAQITIRCPECGSRSRIEELLPTELAEASAPDAGLTAEPGPENSPSEETEASESPPEQPASGATDTPEAGTPRDADGGDEGEAPGTRAASRESEPTEDTAAAPPPRSGDHRSRPAENETGRIRETAHALLPFVLSREEALAAYREWAAAQPIVPTSFANAARQHIEADPVWVPCWHLDAEVRADYTAKQGVRYSKEPPGQAPAGDVTAAALHFLRRLPIRVQWYEMSGRLTQGFERLRLHAGNAMTEGQAEALGPWDFQQATAPEPRHFDRVGVMAATLDEAEAKDLALERTLPALDWHIRRKVGGHAQRIIRRAASFERCEAHRYLLPVWRGSVTAGGRHYGFSVNAQTGRVTGDRPLPVGCIVGVVIVAIVLLFIIP